MSDDEVILVCARVGSEPLLLQDNRVGNCDICGRRVQYRPRTPISRKRCMQCAAALIEDGDEIGTTPAMLEDARAYFRKRMQ